VEAPVGLYWVAKWSGDGRGSVGSAESLERSFSSVGEWYFGAVVAEFPAGMADRLGDGGGGSRSFELVDGGHYTHPVSLS